MPIKFSIMLGRTKQAVLQVKADGNEVAEKGPLLQVSW